MLKVGLTGGIGAGKSVVAARLARLGAVLIDADVLAREVVAPGTDGLREVVAEFGGGVLGPDGALDRPALAARVFGDDAARRALETIIHPRVRARTAELTAAAPADAIVVNDVPLLVESGLVATYHFVIVVTAAEPTRVDRLVRTRAMSPAAAHARIRAQAGEQLRRAAADTLLANDGTLAELAAAVDALWHGRLVPFEANLRAGRPADRAATPVLVDPDPDWPAQARRLIARLAAVAGDHLVRIDHVGPTSVPGLPAADILDIQALVRAPDAADPAAEQCRKAGFVRLPGPRPAVDRHGVPQVERVLVEADPGRPATVSLRAASGPLWRETLLLRDWLRAHPNDRDGYATVQRGWAGRPEDSAARDHGDPPWLSAALTRARAWAAESGWGP